jgi:hypothetical protein
MDKDTKFNIGCWSILFIGGAFFFWTTIDDRKEKKERKNIAETEASYKDSISRLKEKKAKDLYIEKISSVDSAYVWESSYFGEDDLTINIKRGLSKYNNKALVSWSYKIVDIDIIENVIYAKLSNYDNLLILKINESQIPLLEKYEHNYKNKKKYKQIYLLIAVEDIKTALLKVSSEASEVSINEDGKCGLCDTYVKVDAEKSRILTGTLLNIYEYKE